MDHAQMVEFREGTLHSYVQRWISTDPTAANDFNEVWELVKYTTKDPLIICDVLAWYTNIPAVVTVALRNLTDVHVQHRRRARLAQRTEVTEDMFNRAIYARRHRRIPFGQETIPRDGQPVSGLAKFLPHLPAAEGVVPIPLYRTDEQSILYVQSCFDLRMRRYAIAAANFQTATPTVADFYVLNNIAKWMLDLKMWYEANVPLALPQPRSPVFRRPSDDYEKWDWLYTQGPHPPWQNRYENDWRTRWDGMQGAVEAAGRDVRYYNQRHLQAFGVQWFCPNTRDWERVIVQREGTEAEMADRAAVHNPAFDQANWQKIFVLAYFGDAYPMF